MMRIHYGHTITILIFFVVKTTVAENMILPDGRSIDIPEAGYYTYYLNDSLLNENETIVRNYVLIEMKPNTELLCPEGYFINKVLQELFINPNSSNITQAFTTHSASYRKMEGDETNAPCPTIYRCLGFQACLFKFANEFCRKDPARNLRKMLLVSITCKRDTAKMFRILKANYSVSKERGHYVLHLRYRSRLDEEEFQRKRDYNSSVITEEWTPRYKVFGATCQTLDLAVRNGGYAGECITEPADPARIVEGTWALLGRTKTEECRSELVEVFCAFQYNPKGTCIPPFLREKDLNSGRMFNNRSLPHIGKLPTILRKQSRGPKSNLNPARLAFILMLHKDIPAAVELLRSIWRSDHFYAIHIDRRATKNREMLKELLVEAKLVTKNVLVLPQGMSFATSWGSYEIVRAELQSMEELLKMGIWDFVINLSGSDLPLRNVDDLSASLAPHRGLNFLPFVQLRNGRKDTDSEDGHLTQEAFYACDNYVFKVSGTAGMPDLDDFEMYNAPQWGVFSRGFSEYLVDEKRRSNVINKYQFYLQTHVVPDESYIISVLMNAPYRSSLRRYSVHTSKEFVSNNADYLCRHFTDADFCGQGPGLFGISDTQELMSLSHRSFFARKFSGDLKDGTRSFTLGLAHMGYHHFIDTFLPPAIIWSLAVNAISHLSATEERFFGHDLVLDSIQHVRVLPSLVAHDECCRSTLISGLRKITDHHLWMDITFIDEQNDQEMHQFRVSYEPLINGRICYADGDLKMTFLTPWTKTMDGDEDFNFGLQETMPFPFGPAGIKSISIALVFSRDNFSCIEDPINEDKSKPLTINSDYCTFNLTLTLSSLTNGEVCVQEEVVDVSSTFCGNTTSDDEDEPLFHIHSFVFSCDIPLGSGPWTIYVTEEVESQESKIYNLPFYLLDYENESNLETQLDDVLHLWKIKDVSFLSFNQHEELQESRLLSGNKDHINVNEAQRDSPRSEDKKGFLRATLRVVFNGAVCYGGLLLSTLVYIFIHRRFSYRRVRHRFLLRYLVMFSVASVLQTILLLRFC